MSMSLTLAVAMVVVASSATATTISPPPNLGELAKMSSAVVLARAGESVAIGEGEALPHTLTRFEKLEQVSGLGVSHEFEVVEPGAVRDAFGVAITGSPRYREGDVYLLFLDRRSDGSWRSRMLAFGLLRRAGSVEGNILEPLPEAAHMNTVELYPSETVGVYREGHLLNHLREVVSGEVEWQAESVLAETSDRVQLVAAAADPSCEWIRSSNDNNGVRWFDFDTGGNFTLSPTTPDQEGVDGAAAVTAATSAWRGHPYSKINLYSGSAVSGSGCKHYNGVLFNDPCDDISDLSSCGGVLAYGGPRFYSDTQTFDGQPWHAAIQMFVVVNNGSECLGQTNFNEMITHEIGHGLGFGHHADSGSTMHEYCCRGWGASLGATDEACASYLYPDESSTGPPPATPTGLAATNTSEGRVSLSWSNGGISQSSVEIQRSVGSGSFSALASAAGTATSYVDQSVANGTTYRYRIRGINANGASGWSNIASVMTPPPTSGSAPSTDPIVAAAAHKQGKKGTFWSTNMALVNASESMITSGVIRFLTGSGPTVSVKSFSIKPRYMTTLDDIVGEMGLTATGGLVVEVDDGRPAPLVMTRTFTPGPAGTYGHATPGQLPLATGTYYLTGVRGGPNFRTNFGVAVSGEASASAKLTLRLPNKTVPGPTMPLPAGSMSQWAVEGLFGSPLLEGVDSATLEVELTGQAVIYIAVVDMQSGDPVYISGSQPSANWQVPLIGRGSGKRGTFWDTDIVIHNPDSSSAIVELEWLTADEDNRSGNPTKQLTLAARETRLVESAPKTLWNIDKGNGSVMVSGTRKIVVEARTWTPVPDGLPGTMGQRVIPIDLSQVQTAPTVLPWAREDSSVRTNIGFVNRSSSLVTLELRLFRSLGTVQRYGEVTLAPRSVSQRSMVNLFGSNPLGEGRGGWVKVIGATGDQEVFASQIVNDSGDPIFVPGS
jgi:hypothetical protein